LQLIFERLCDSKECAFLNNVVFFTGSSLKIHQHFPYQQIKFRIFVFFALQAKLIYLVSAPVFLSAKVFRADSDKKISINFHCANLCQTAVGGKLLVVLKQQILNLLSQTDKRR
jgi:hypothetical protein